MGGGRDRRHAVNPGGVATGLQRNFTPRQRRSLDAAEAAGVFTYKTVEQGAATSIVAAVFPAFAHSGGHYLDDAREAYTVPNDADLARHPTASRNGARPRPRRAPLGGLDRPPALLKPLTRVAAGDGGYGGSVQLAPTLGKLREGRLTYME